jgi:hypothetical protein
VCTLILAFCASKFDLDDARQNITATDSLVPRVETRLAALFENERVVSFYAGIQIMQVCGVFGIHVTQVVQGYAQGVLKAFTTSICVDCLLLVLLCTLIRKIDKLDTIALEINYKNKYSQTMMFVWLFLFLQSTIPLYFKIIITRVHIVSVKTFAATYFLVSVGSILRNVLAGNAFQLYPSRFLLLVGVPLTLFVPTIATIISIAMVREFRFAHDMEACQNITRETEMHNLSEMHDEESRADDDLALAILQAEKIDTALGDTCTP